MKQYHAIVNGKEYNNGQWVAIVNPVNGEKIGEVPALSTQEINEIYEYAKKAQKPWEQLSLFERIKFLNNWKELIVRDQEVLAQLITLEVAKGIKASITEVIRSLEYLDYTIEEAKRMHPLSYSGEAFGVKNKIGIFSFVPKGIVLAISPFNYPVNLAIAKLAPALITGNSVVFKPATQGSLVGLHLAKLALEAKFPDGVFQAVSGRGKDIGDALVENKNINVISFTGSSQVGKNIMEKSHKIDAILELGGKDPAIVLKDCQLEDTATKIIKGAFSYSGQRCTAIKLVLVEEDIADNLIATLMTKINQLTVGDPNNNCDITPVIDQKTVDRCKLMVDNALNAGASCLFGHKYEKNLMWPTLLDYVQPTMEIALEEPFAPVLPIIRIKNIQEAIDIANNSQYGLQASIFTQDIDQAMSMSKKLNVGTVNINDQSQRGPDHFPFIGIKDSGLGVQGIRESLLAFTRPKGLIINWRNNKS